MKKWPLIISILIAAVYSGEGTYWWTSWAIKWASLMALLSAWIGIHLSQKIHWSVGPAFFWTMLSGILVFAGRGYIYSGQEVGTLIAYKNAACFASICFMALSVFFLISLDCLEYIETAIVCLCWVGLVASYVTWIQLWGIRDDGQGARFTMGGLFGNPSMNLCFLAFAAPILISRVSAAAGVIYCVWLFIAIAISTRLMPAITFAAVIAAFVLAKHKSTRTLIWSGGVATALLGASYVFARRTDLNTHGRWGIWDLAMSYWWDPANGRGLASAVPLPVISPWMGSGLGTTQILVPTLQVARGDTTDFFMWIHNDFLQGILEQGIIGAVLYAIVAICVIRKSWKTPYLFASVVGMSVAMCGNYPFRMAFMAFFGAFLVVRVLSSPQGSKTKRCMHV